MLSFNNLLIPILGGFIFVKYCQLTKYRAVRDNGYIILFKSAICGLIFYGISFTIWRAAILDESANPKIPEWIGYLTWFLGNEALVPTLFSLLVMLISLGILNYILDGDMMKRKVIREDDDALEVIIQDVYDQDKNLQVTLDSGKVYNGTVMDTYFRVNDEIRSIQLSPISSGYRDKETQRLILTTYYADIYQKIAENPEAYNVKISDFSVTIRYNHIISVSPFDPQTYAEFQVE